MKLLFLLWILPVTLGDTHVTCVYSEECMLPCTSSLLEIIHWNKDTTPVHSFYHKADQLSHQSAEYKGRTSLPPKLEIDKGNVSLLLKNIKPKDEGRYKCYTANDKSNSEQFVSVSVEAPVKSVDIALEKETVICTTIGVYPEPHVEWYPSTKEPSNTFEKAEDNLFKVTSIIEVGAITDTYKYICTMKSKDRKKTQYTAILEQAPQPTSDKLSFECPATKGFQYTLNFSSNTILKYDSKNSTDDISEQWRGKISRNQENGTITINLNEVHSGTYRWDCSTDHNKLVKTIILQGGGKTGHIITGIAIFIFIILIIVGIGLFVKWRKKFNEDKHKDYGFE